MKQLHTLLGIILALSLIVPSSGFASQSATPEGIESSTQSATDQGDTAPAGTPAETSPTVAPPTTSDVDLPQEPGSEAPPADTGQEEISTTGPPAEIPTTEPASDDTSTTDAAAPVDGNIQQASLMSPLAASHTVVVTVTDFFDAPIAGATVVAQDLSGVAYSSGTTDSLGQVTLTVPLGEVVDFAISKDGYDSRTISVITDAETTSYLFWMDTISSGTITVEMVFWDDVNGYLPVSGATVQVRQSGIVVAHAVEGSTPGTYVSPVLDYGVYELVMSHSNYESSSTEFVTVNGDVTVNWSVLEILPGTITVTVLDANSSNTIANAQVFLTLNNTAIASNTTDANGVTSFPNVAGGGYELEVTAAGYQGNTEFVFVRGDASATVSLSPAIGGTVSISVTERGTTTPVAGATVVITTEAGEEILTLTTNASGSVSTSELGFGRFYASISKDGYLTENRIPIWNDGGDDVSTTIERIVTGTATVRIFNQDTNANIANASILVTEESTGAQQTITTNSEGIATFTATNGGYSFDVSADGFMNIRRSMMYSNDSTSVEIPLQSRVAGTATLTVRSLVDNSVLSGVSVSVTNEAGTVVHTQTTGADGLITTAQLPGGVYIVSLQKDGFGASEEAITIRGNLTTDLYMQVNEPGTFTAIAQDANTSFGINGATVTIFQAENVTHYTVNVGGLTQIRYLGDFGSIVASGTTVDGTFVSAPLAPGHYIVWIEADGYAFNSSQAYLLNTNISQTIRLDPGNPTQPPTGNGNPTETPIVTETPVSTETPGSTQTPVATETPGSTQTPIATEVPGSTQTPVATEVPGSTQTPVATEVPGASQTPVPATTGILSLGFALCDEESCEDVSHQYDGYTVIWTVTPLQTAATNEIQSAQIASVGMIGQPVSLATMQQTQSFTISGVIENGIAAGSSEPILIGSYNVCLNPVITGPNGEEVSIASAEICADVDVTSSGNVLLPFAGVAGSIAVGEPTDIPVDGNVDESPSDEKAPGNTAEAQSGSKSGTANTVVNDLPNTGSGHADESHSGWVLSSILLLAILAVGTRRKVSAS